MKWKESVIIFMCLLGIQSCKNDIEINAPWKETPVVNGFLDINSASQFIRITKTFQNASNLNPQQAAQISDSLYFDTMVVKVIDISSTPADTFYFTRKDTLNKDAGYFASDKNYLYCCNTLQPKLADVYQLSIYNPKSGNTYTSQTSIVDKAVVMPRNIPPNNYKLDIYYNSNIPDYISFEWGPAKNAVIYTGLIRYYFTENNVNKSVDQYVSINEEAVFTYFFKAVQMNQYLINIFGKIDPNASDTIPFRIMKTVDYVVLSGSSDLKIAVDLSKPNTSLLQVKPEFSNITGGIGLFTSRSTSIKNIPFDTKTPYDNAKNLTINVKGFPQK